MTEVRQQVRLGTAGQDVEHRPALDIGDHRSITADDLDLIDAENSRRSEPDAGLQLFYKVVEDVPDGLLVQRHLPGDSGEGFAEAVRTHIVDQTAGGLPLAVQVGDGLELGLAAGGATVTSPVDQDAHRLAVRRRVLERLPLRAVSMQTACLALLTGQPIGPPRSLNEVVVIIPVDGKRFEAGQLKEVGHAAPGDEPTRKSVLQASTRAARPTP